METRPVRVLLVDDEPIARQVLRAELDSQPDVVIVGEVDNGVRALIDIEALEPDVVFLDLQMPEMGGLDVVRQMRGGTHLPIVIIVTAYDEHALTAFDEGAVDYLLKPVSESRLVRSLERARRLLGSRLDGAANPGRIADAATPVVRKIIGRSGNDYVLLNANEVLAFQADGEFVWIITAKHRYQATQSLRKIEGKLKGSSFRRVHRNTLVNVDHVERMASLSSNRWLITLDNNQEFVVSKRLARNVRQILKW
jgi:two-component system LytT family response regulator